jgi:hypothetical protein
LIRWTNTNQLKRVLGLIKGGMKLRKKPHKIRRSLGRLIYSTS